MGRAKKLEAAGGFVAADPGVVAGGETIGADLASHAEQRVKLHLSVAVGASDRSASAEIVLHERAHNAIFKVLLKVYDVVGKVKMLRDALGVVDIVQRAAAMLRRAVIGEGTLQFGQAALIPELHGKRDDGASVLLQNGGNGGRIHSTRHRDSDESGLSLSTDRQHRFKLGSVRHLSFTSLACQAQMTKRERRKMTSIRNFAVKIDQQAVPPCRLSQPTCSTSLTLIRLLHQRREQT